MSLSKHQAGISLTLALIAGLGLSACQVRPLYSTNTIAGQSLAAELSSISIVSAHDRIEQEIRNHLIFAFNGGGEAAAPLYRLAMKVSNSVGNLNIESGTGLSTTSRVQLRVTYSLVRLADGKEVTTGSSFFTASFAKSNQRFANERALLDAENRAAEQVANDIQLRLSAFFAAGT